MHEGTSPAADSLNSSQRTWLPPQDHGLGADRGLALSYVPPTRRRRLSVLWDLDATLGRLVAAGTESAITQIKLAWWRDALETLDDGRVPREPLLQALAGLVLPAGVSGTRMAEMTEGWIWLLTADTLGGGDLSEYAARRGGLLFRLSARLLDEAENFAVEPGGEVWSLVDLARRTAKVEDKMQALAAARRRIPDLPTQWPVRIRPLGMLAMLARRDAARTSDRLERQGSPARMFRMLRHRLTGF